MDSIISMYNATNFPFSTSTIFVALATFAGTMKLIRSMTNDMPSPARSYLESTLNHLITPNWNRITIVVNKLHDDMTRNQLYDAAESYLRTRINTPHTKRLNVSKTPKQNSLHVSVDKGQETLIDKFDDMELKWRLVSNESQNQNGYFELSFNYKKFKLDRVLDEYLPHVLAEAKKITVNNDKVIKLYTRSCSFGKNESDSGRGGGGGWCSINLDRPATFETFEMESKLKETIIDDLKGLGKARKRCYLLYGPPGTGKSSLIVAMANYLKFDVYDLEIRSLSSDLELRSLLMSTTNRSIVVIRDVNDSVEVEQPYARNKEVSISCLLSLIDDLSLSCGGERIIVFTTNYKPCNALSCPSLVDMHIRMSYCTNQEFKLLASKYLDIHDHHHSLFNEIKDLLENEDVTIAEVAEELSKSKDPDIALKGVVNLLERRKMEAHVIKQDRFHGLN